MKLGRNRNGNGKENVKKETGLMDKATTLHVNHWPFSVNIFAVRAQLRLH